MGNGRGLHGIQVGGAGSFGSSVHHVPSLGLGGTGSEVRQTQAGPWPRGLSRTEILWFSGHCRREAEVAGSKGNARGKSGTRFLHCLLGDSEG